MISTISGPFYRHFLRVLDIPTKGWRPAYAVAEGRASGWSIASPCRIPLAGGADGDAAAHQVLADIIHDDCV
jgi:hypothetical protein